MTARPAPGPLWRLAHRGVSRGVGAVARRCRWPGAGSRDGGPGSGASVRRLAVPTAVRSDASVLLVTPAGDAARLPVVYLLHGFPDAPEAPLAAGLARAVVGGATWPPFVLAVPDGARWRRGDHEWADAADGRDLLESWLVEAVVPAVEAGTPRPPARRTLAGFSMGGYGALNVGLRRPGAFGSLVSFSGYFSADDPEGALGGDPRLLHDNSPLARLQDPALRPARGLRVALVEQRHEPRLVRGQAAAVAEVLRGVGADVLEVHGPGRHSWRSVAACWPRVLTWSSAGWGSPAS